MKETPPNTSLHHINHTPGVHIKPFFTGTPFRRELQPYFVGHKNKSPIQKSQKEHVTKDFSNRTLTSSRPI